MSAQLRTPVALLIFNRPETTRQVFAAIRSARPTRLLVVADGPRPARPGEAALCAETRAIATAVDWPCEVSTSFAEANMGCRGRVSSGLDWVFQTVEEAIILEDDCLPHPDFFPFCAELLDRYRDDQRVMHIGGANFQSGRRYGEASYYFSRYAHVWGWASWRRAWRRYDVAMAGWPRARRRLLGSFAQPTERRYWRYALDGVARGRIDTWDFQWAYACMEHGGLAAVPNVNLITNLGFGAGATHTIASSPYAALPTAALTWPLRHPDAVAPRADADLVVGRRMFSRHHTLWRAIKRLGRSLAPRAARAME